MRDIQVLMVAANNLRGPISSVADPGRDPMLACEPINSTAEAGYASCDYDDNPITIGSLGMCL